MKAQAQTQINFDRIAAAIAYIQKHVRHQPSLEAVATHIGLSPAHFQRLFTEWAGTSPKKFVQYLSLQYAKELLKHEPASLVSVSANTGLSGTGRLHDLFVHIEGMTPGEYKNGGANLIIKYAFSDSPFGRILIASTSKGIAYLAFVGDEASALATLKKKFPKAAFTAQSDTLQKQALAVFATPRAANLSQLKFHLKGSPFQLKVWEALLRIPAGSLVSYGAIATAISHPHANRAVGTAVGQNPVAFLIPCHRVIQSTGHFGNYYWGRGLKTAMIGWEQAQTKNPSMILPYPSLK